MKVQAKESYGKESIKGIRQEFLEESIRVGLVFEWA